MNGKADQSLLMRQARVKKIPTGWKLSTVGEVCSIRNDLRKPISLEEREKIKGQYPYYGPTGVLNYINEYRLDGKFALIGEDGDHFLKYKSWSQTQLVEGKANVNNHAHVIESTPTCSVEWFRIFFEHRDLTDFLTRQGAGRFKLNKATLQQLPIPIPPIHEQKQIAEILATWDEAIALTEKAIEAKRKRKSALRQKLLSGKSRLKQFQAIKWSITKLGEIAEIRRGASPRPIDNPEYFSEIGRGWVRIADVTASKTYLTKTTQYLSKLGESKSVSVDPGDLIMSICATIGVPRIVKMKACIHDGFVVIRPKSDQFNRLFLYHFLDSISPKLAGSGQPGTQKNLNTKIVSSIEIPSISIDEQNEISNFLSLIDEEIYKLEEQRLRLQLQKQGLMQKLLTGEWRVAIQEAA